MKNYNHIFFGAVNARLVSVLRIGGESEEHFEMAVNGENEYMIPASGLAGAVRAYLTAEGKSAEVIARWFGTGNAEGKLCFYDALLMDPKLELRYGIQVDAPYGVAKDKKLHKKYYIAPGSEVTFYMSGFAQEKEIAEIKEVFKDVVEGIQKKRITVGAGKTNGFGQLDIIEAKYRVLDLRKHEDLQLYLTGFSPAMLEAVRSIEVKNFTTELSEGEFVLTASIPNGLLVRAGAGAEDSMVENASEQGSNETDAGIPQGHNHVPSNEPKNQVARNMESLRWVDPQCGSSGSSESGVPGKETTVGKHERDQDARISDTSDEMPEQGSGERKSVPIIPGTTIKGLIRAYGKKVGAFYHIPESYLDMIFGTEGTAGSDIDQVSEGMGRNMDDVSLNLPSKDAVPQKRRSFVMVQDCEIHRVRRTEYHRIKINRWTGGTMGGALLTDEVLSTDPFENHQETSSDPVPPITFRVRVDPGLKNINVGDRNDQENKSGDKSLYPLACALVFLALRDVGLGLLPVGSGNSVGYGRLQGIGLNVTMEEKTYQFEFDGDDGLTCQKSGDDIKASEASRAIEALLKGIQDYGGKMPANDQSAEEVSMA